MITRTGNGRLTRDVTVHHSLPQDGRHLLERRDRNADPVYLDPIVWQA